MKKLMVYSHDTFGLGNVRRMLSICKQLIDSIPDLSILFITGSPMIHCFRIPLRFDYVKLPCLSRTDRDSYSVKYLNTRINETVKLRSDLILNTAKNFKPDLLLIDKKPYGVKKELAATVAYIKTHCPNTKLVLLLRDILDSQEQTKKIWKEQGYYKAIQSYYDLLLIVGEDKIFDSRKEYCFPASASEKVRFCGYIKKEVGSKSPATTKKELKIGKEKLILVTAGGGEDGYTLLDTYIKGLERMPIGHNTKSLIVCGPEMPDYQKKELYKNAARYPHAQICEFTSDLISYMDASDLIVSMGGYNTICEILSLNKRAIVVPRFRPVREQWMRADRLAQLGFIKTIHPDLLTTQNLIQTVLHELNSINGYAKPSFDLHLRALPNISRHVSNLLNNVDSVDADKGDLKEIVDPLKDSMILDFGHEINNPNSIIMFNAPLIEDAWKDAVPILLEYYRKHGEFSLGGLPFSEMRGTMPKLLNGISDGSQRINKVTHKLKNVVIEQ